MHNLVNSPPVIAAEQSAFLTLGEETVRISLPDASTELLPGVKWGRCERFGTPAYWKLMAAHHGNALPSSSYRLGENLTEEVAACLLGGFGMPAEIGLAAFRRLKDRGLLKGPSSEGEILAALIEPLTIRGRSLRYRYPGQKARYLSQALDKLLVEDRAPALAGRDLRDWLNTFSGIGFKTSSWIVRNHLSCDDVAILDVHIVRAGRIVGIFAGKEDVTRHYLSMEESFLRFANAIGTPASLLDSLIWEQMRTIPLSALSPRVAA